MLNPSFKNHFLIAMPGLSDTGFQQSVTYICEHHQGGAMGIIINQPLKLTVGELFSQLDLDVRQDALKSQHLYYGGPVQKERGFVLHTAGKRWEATLAVSEDMCITGSRDILVDMAADQGPQQALIALGYAGWEAGQLEAEIAANSWLTVAADEQIIFDTDHKDRWVRAAGKLGFDVTLMASTPGHA
ncbi:MAG: YqgE/AlgH family protein [Cellvibrionaceae bacterium]|nr:YqgE/AlgH family protein [Cellvibrionaceae bacterium]